MNRPTRVESAAATRSALLAAATALFMKDGFARTTINAIVREAGFTRGAFYAHFTSKDEVLVSIVAGLADEATPRLLKLIAACTTGDQVIDAISRWVAERSQSQDVALLILEAARVGELANNGLPALFTARWTIVGEAIAKFFPDRDLNLRPDEIVAIVVGLTYGPVGSGLTGHDAGRLVSVALRAVLGTVHTS
ncbi:AcrR family transcriptional regulator [Sphingomonas sp. BE138]|uniref:TetR/AcrR family transcriptional regulator n=1 Tax=Sphingomonas sp. BE138 TaxID=2817845 RepID=UPI00285F56FB|nr:TetR/AcrR family transcriptional regulator [Sphingomonas sp. BE138]MDR6789160.1 AcrR family transcriptional regulator [Sphingomonas sp. BE138]